MPCKNVTTKNQRKTYFLANIEQELKQSISLLIGLKSKCRFRTYEDCINTCRKNLRMKSRNLQNHLEVNH